MLIDFVWLGRRESVDGGVVVTVGVGADLVGFLGVGRS